MAGHDPYSADEHALIGALRIVDLIDGIEFIKTFLSNTAKNAAKQAATAPRRKHIPKRRR